MWLLEWRFLTGEPRDRFVAERHRYEREAAEGFWTLLRDGMAPRKR